MLSSVELLCSYWWFIYSSFYIVGVSRRFVCFYYGELKFARCVGDD